MKKILFDLSECQPKRSVKFHGGGIYGYILFETFVRKYSESVVAYVDRSKYLPDNISDLIRKFSVQVISVEERTLASIFTDGICDALYSPLYHTKYEALFKLKVPVVVTVHGLRALEMNRDRHEYLYAAGFKTRMLALLKQTPLYSVFQRRYYSRFDALFRYEYANIITVSEHSRNSIKVFYPFVDDSRIKVRYSVSTTDKTICPEKNDSNDTYYLIISADRWLKNSYRALMAFDYLASNGLTDKMLYVVGMDADSALLKKIKCRHRIKCFKYVARDILESLFANAYAFIYPSLNEGFGYPPLEAMKYGTPAIVSPVSSIPEICAESVIYADPYSYMEIANRILQMETPQIHEYYSIKGKKRAEHIETRQKQDLEGLCNDIISIIKGKR